MTYKKLLKNIAEEYNTTSKEVENQIKLAIKMAGYNMQPEEFIIMLTQKVKSKM